MQDRRLFRIIAVLSVRSILGSRINALSEALETLETIDTDSPTRGPLESLETIASNSGNRDQQPKILAICTSLSEGDVRPLLPIAAAFAADRWQVHFFATEKWQPELYFLDAKVKISTPRAQSIYFEDVLAVSNASFKFTACDSQPKEGAIFNGMWKCSLLNTAAFLESGLESRLTKLRPDAIINAPHAMYGKLMGRRLQTPAFTIITWAMGTVIQTKSMPFMSPPGESEKGEEWVSELRHGSNHVEEGVAKIKSMGLWRDDIDFETFWSDPEYPTFLLTSEEATMPNAIADIKEMNSIGGKFVFTGPVIDPSLVTKHAGNDTLIAQVQASKKEGRKIVLFSFGTTFPISNKYLKEMYKCMKHMESVAFIIAHARQDELPSTLDDITKPRNVMTMRWVPQIPLLQVADAFITHGGQNSMMEAFVQSVPLVVVPWQADQPKNAWHVHNYGAGRAIPTPHVVRLQAQDHLTTKYGLSEKAFDEEINKYIRDVFSNGPEGRLYKSVASEIAEKGDFYLYKTTYLERAIEKMYEKYGDTAPEMVSFDDAPNVIKHVFADLTEILQNQDIYTAKAGQIGKSLIQAMADVGANGIVSRVNSYCSLEKDT